MPTIDVNVVDCVLEPEECEISWFNLSISPFEHHSPKHESLFSPSLTVEVLSPPNVSEDPSSPRPWENPPDPKRATKVCLLRDCYLPELSTTLETRSKQALGILQHKTSAGICNDDITNIADNIIDSEILCTSLAKRQLNDMKQRIITSMHQSLSSSTFEEDASAE